MADQGSFFPGKKEYTPDKTLRNVSDPLAYEVRKLQMAIRAVDKELFANPGKINIKDYLFLLETHTTKIKSLKQTDYFKRKGIENDEERVDSEISLEEGEEGTGEEVSSGVDPGVRTENPFTS